MDKNYVGETYWLLVLFKTQNLSGADDNMRTKPEMTLMMPSGYYFYHVDQSNIKEKDFWQLTTFLYVTLNVVEAKLSPSCWIGSKVKTKIPGAI